MIRFVFAFLFTWTLATGTVAAAPPAGGEPPAPGSARITYLVGNSAYLDAGTDAGLTVGARVEVVRGGKTVATLRVEYLSSRRASCSIQSSEGDLAVGDTARFVPAAVPPSPPEPSPAARPAASGSSGWARGLGLRGRLGIRYLAVSDLTGAGEDFSQPAVDANITGRRVGGSDFDLALDVRTRRTYRTRVDGETSNSGLTHVYRLNLAWRRQNSPYRISVGRQFSSEFASVSLFDGVLLERTGSRWGGGLFGGTEPEPVSLDFTTQVTEFGAYTQWRSPAGAPLRWALTGGWTISTDSGSFNREFLFLRGRVSGKRLFGTLSQEVDVNRGWKAVTEGASLSPTSTYLNLRYRLDPRVSVTASVDNRRRVRLYRDRETPESDFDDSFRQGIFAGVDTRPWRFLHLGVGMAHHLGSTGGNARSYTITSRILAPVPVAVEASTRHTRYTGPWISGWLHTVGISRRLGSRLDAEVHGGIRRETRDLAIPEPTRINWWGGNLDVSVTRGWYLLFSAERTGGGDEDNSQIYTSLSYRF